MHPVFTQTLSYMVVLIFALLILSFLQRGFFWKFLRVRASFGRFVLVKIRSINRDHYSVGKIHGSFLVFKGEKGDKRINIPSQDLLYRSLGVTWVDVDGDKDAIGKHDYSSVAGFDAEKYNNLYLRALYKPQIVDTKEKLIIGAIIITALLVAVSLWLVYNQGNDIGMIKEMIINFKPGTVTASSGL